MSFLGRGVPPPTVSWGSTPNDSRAHLFDTPHLVLFPALAVMLAALSFNCIGGAPGVFPIPVPAYRQDSGSTPRASLPGCAI